jgi:hypothetical protein
MSQLINQLADSATYQYRVGLPCGTGKYVFSTAQEFTTPAANHIKRNFQCGVLPQTDLSNRSPLVENLSPNEVFMAGDFPVTIISASGSAGTYSGTGYIVVPYLGDTKIAVTFKNIQLNTDRQLIAGAVETTYDTTESAVYDFKAAIDQLKETFNSISNQIDQLVDENKLTVNEKTKLDSLKNEATKEIDQAENLNNKIDSLQNQLSKETNQSKKDSIQNEISDIKTAQEAIFDAIKNKTAEFQKIIDKYYASASKFDGIIVNPETDLKELSNTTYRPDDYKVMITFSTDSLYAKYSPDFENTEGRFVIWLLYDKTEHKVKYKIKYEDSFFNNQIKKDEYLQYFNKFTAYYTSDSQDWGYKIIDEFYKFNTLIKTSQETGFDIKKLFDAQCADRALKRTIESIVKQPAMPAMSVCNGAIEYGICITEEDKLTANSNYALKFYYGFLNELFLTVDVNKMAEGISEIVAKNIIKEINCLTNTDNIVVELTGTGISEERLNFVLKCAGLLTPDDLSKYEELINSAWQWAKANYDNPYYHGKATCFIASIVIPYVGELKALRGLKAEQALNAVSHTEPYYDDFVRLSKELEGKNADEAVRILSKEKGVAGKILKVGDEIAGIKIVNIHNGTNGKYAIIGRSMGGKTNEIGVIDFSKELKKKIGEDNVVIFDNYKAVIDGEELDMQNCLDDLKSSAYNSYKDKTTNLISYEGIKKTKLYKLNQHWANYIKEKGYTVIDIGNPNNKIDPSAFYDLETNIFFGR